jgi:hypothetical protein
MHEYEVAVYRDGRWWMIHVREIDQFTQARHAGEIELMARELIAVSTDQPMDTVAVQRSPRQSQAGGVLACLS